MTILGIETSCDETAVAIVDFSGSKKKPVVRVLSNIVSSQVKLHAKFGGVVPNLAKREHQKNLVPILLRALKEAGLLNPKHEARNSKQIQNRKFKVLKTILERESELLKSFQKSVLKFKPPKVDAIAVTYGPGLAPALWVGVNFAKALSYLWDKPLIPVNHMEGHLFSALLQKSGKNDSRFMIHAPRFPAVALLVSGGHTELVLMKSCGKYKTIGETLDDAAGEAFDKVARILGLGYPGGPEISRIAEKPIASGEPHFWREAKNQQPEAGSRKPEAWLPRPMINSKDFNFSFSGLKTAVLYLVRDLERKYSLKKIRPVIAKKFQDAVVEVLVKKTIRAAKEYDAKTILLGGGVAANKLLRQELSKAVGDAMSNVKCQMSDVALTGDNALMVALAAYYKKSAIKNWKTVLANANLRLS